MIQWIIKIKHNVYNGPFLSKALDSRQSLEISLKYYLSINSMMYGLPQTTDHQPHRGVGNYSLESWPKKEYSDVALSSQSRALPS